MNSKSFFLAATFAGALLGTASAATLTAPASFASPVPVRIVAPTALPRSHIGAIVTLRLNVDAAGQPSNIRVLSDRDPALAKRLVEAVSQWQFTPARQNGIAVGATIELPLELIED